MQINLQSITPDQGLTDVQVQSQQRSGLVNQTNNRVTQSVWSIIKTNTFTLFNFINLVLAFFVFETGSYRNLLFLVVAVANTIIGTFQELRSKHKMDQLALLAQAHPTVIRNGQLMKIAVDQIVQGDVIALKMGDQIPVDGPVLQTDTLEVDESQITGEATSISKPVGAALTSGSYVISGHAKMLAERIGDQSFVNQITHKAQSGKDRNGAMLNAINKIIRILTFIIVPLGIVLFTSRMMHDNNVNKAILGTTAAMTGMIPEGLVLLSSVTMAVSAMKLTRKRVLVRNLPAIETLARVDTICLDKTGTLTSGNLEVKQLINHSERSDTSLRKLIGNVVRTIDDDNATAKALKAAFEGQKISNAEVVAFSSARKWSGVATTTINYVLGAPQFIDAHLPKEQAQLVDNYANQGYRVLAVAKTEAALVAPLKAVQILGWILIKDQIRPNAEKTLRYLSEQGISINVISGDDPRTVSQIAQSVNITGAKKLIDMSRVEDPDYVELTRNYHVFGRVTPQQKESLIQAYQADKHIVAMTGDGVNDLLALKQSDCGIAMGSGNDSTQSVANFVLIDSNFDAMIPVLKEGRRVINNISSVSSLYLIKTIYSLLLSILFVFARRDYPFEPIQLTPISTFMIGIPSFILAFEGNYERVVDQFFLKIKKIAVPAALVIVVDVILVTIIGHFSGLKFAQTSTLNVLATGIICWIALLEVNQPLNRFKWWVTLATGLAFLILFFIFGSAFLLISIWQMPLLIIAIGIIVLGWPMFRGIQLFVMKLLKLKSELK